jgi:hypothetical protein
MSQNPPETIGENRCHVDPRLNDSLIGEASRRRSVRLLVAPGVWIDLEKVQRFTSDR